MKKTILILIVLLMTSVAYAGSDTVIVTQYDNGAIKTETSMKDGVRNGPSRFYTDDGHLVFVFEYKDGVPHGQNKYFYDSGKLYDLTIYKDGTFIERNIFNEDGSLAYVSTIEGGNCVERDSTNKVIYSQDARTDKYCK